jgi:hypothetical protein
MKNIIKTCNKSLFHGWVCNKAKIKYNSVQIKGPHDEAKMYCKLVDKSTFAFDLLLIFGDTKPHFRLSFLSIDTHFWTD